MNTTHLKIETEPPNVYGDTVADIEIKQEIEVTEVDDRIFLQGYQNSTETTVYSNDHNNLIEDEDLVVQDQIVKEEPIFYDAVENQVLQYLNTGKGTSIEYSECSTLNLDFNDITNQTEDKTFECYICRCETINIALLKWHLQERHALEPLSQNQHPMKAKLKDLFKRNAVKTKTQAKTKSKTNKKSKEGEQQEESKKQYLNGSQAKKLNQQKDFNASKQSLQSQTIESVFKCSHCHRSFNSKQSVRKHEIIHMKDHQFKCQDCSKGFRRKENYETHMRIHTGEKPYSCKCGKKFRSYSMLHHHKKLHINGKIIPKPKTKQLALVKNVEPDDFPKFRIYECYLCRLRIHYNQLKVHIMEQHTSQKLFQCKNCSKKFTNKQSIKNHMKKTHSKSNLSECKFCGKVLSSRECLIAHLQSHTGEYKHECKYCQKKFSSVHILRIHIRTHTGLKPFECEYCKKGFLKRADMVRHTRVHTGERPYKCDICQATFTRNHLLTDHKRSSHQPFIM